MGFCLDPCDWFSRIYGLSVGPFIRYPYDYPWSDGGPLRLLMPVDYPAEDAKVPDPARKDLDGVSEFFG